MTDFKSQIYQVTLEDEMKQSYLDYAMSVIVGRALPDARDGLKPVHRRALFAMRELGNEYNKPYKKSARVVGDVIGKYHPHGDSAAYETIVRMAQPFSMRYLLVDGQGNFGSVDGDSPAAMRYTEIRMSRFAQDMLIDIEKDTVDFIANYDETEYEPTVLPARIPNLLVNGSSGIAVGMATNIPPHNLGEVISACISLLDNPDITVSELMKIIPGPDFPTAGIIHGKQGILEAYSNGKGRVYIRARNHTEKLGKTEQESIIITELPYQVNKARLIEKIAELVRDKKVEGISELRDESDKDGMRVVIELKRGEIPDIVLNNLYKHTQLQSVFGINIVALINGQPKVLKLKDLLECFLLHRKEVVTRRTAFDLSKARDRSHILEGQMIALANIDEIISLIKSSSSPKEAKVKLITSKWKPGQVTEMLKVAGQNLTKPEGLDNKYGLIGKSYILSDVQAQAILDLRLHRLTALEQDKILSEYKEIVEKIKNFNEILTNASKLNSIIRSELEEVDNAYADKRRTEIIDDFSDLTVEDLIPEEDLVVTLSHGGYIKSQPVTAYHSQKRGGRGRSATKVKDEDFIDQLFVANSHDTLLCFSSKGKVYWLKVYQVPQAGYGARGRPIVNLLPLEDDERISSVLPINKFDEDKYVFFTTSKGRVKKTSLDSFSRPRANGIIAIDLSEEDKLIGTAITHGKQEIMLFASSGKAICFSETDVRIMGRKAAGVRGIKLANKDDEVISLAIPDKKLILIATENGFGKRTLVSDFKVQGRGGQGVIAIQTSDRNGKVVGALQISENDEIMLISSSGTLVRTTTSDISVMGRNTQGVRLIRLDDGDKLVGLERVEAIQENDS
tara:strand:+ start:7709 stop:10252 length:2544 start_codon:yes stop_codon:yes gene_type:complete